MSGGEYSRLTSRPDSVVKDFWRSGLRAWNAASSVFSQAWSSLRIASSFLGSSMASSIETLVEEQLAAALGEVIDVAARREAQRAVHPDGRGVGFLGGGKEPGAGAFRLDGPVELPRDYLPPMIGLHDHQRDERAVEPVGRVGEASHHASIVAGDEELATVQRGLGERLSPPRADQLVRQGGARRDIVELSGSDLHHAVRPPPQKPPPHLCPLPPPPPPSPAGGEDQGEGD